MLDLNLIFLSLVYIFNSQANEAHTIWKAWLQCKSIERQLLREHPVIKSCISSGMQNHSLAHSSRLPLALILNEPVAAAVASYELCVELEMSLKWHAIPSQRPRFLELYRVLSVYLASRRALGIETSLSHFITTSDVFVDAPKLLSCLWKVSGDQTRPINCDRAKPGILELISSQPKTDFSSYALVQSDVATLKDHAGGSTPACLGLSTSCVAATYAIRLSLDGQGSVTSGTS